MRGREAGIVSLNDWADIVTGGITAGILVLGAAFGIWKFVLQQPFGNHWKVAVSPCKVRRVGEQWAYIVTVDVDNMSSGRHHMHGWWCTLRFPDEVDGDYDPNDILPIRSVKDACTHFNKCSTIKAPYPLASQERYSDQMIRLRKGDLQGVCYVEFALKYQEGLGLPDVEYPAEQRTLGERWLAQIMISPVEREDIPETRDIRTHQDEEGRAV